MNQDYRCASSTYAATCGCCEGVEVLTPLAVANRPGLSALRYRVGTHGAFLETMRARLSGDDPRLAGLTSHDAGDFSLALLDAWATVADVLTFYQERIANEGYLRTATERRSLLELAHLVGYKPRPGVASSVYLAYTLNDQGINKDEEFIIPKSTRSQSKPAPGEQPQTFETSEPLKARAAWNNLQVRLTQPQTRDTIKSGKLYLKGTATRLEKGMPLLIDFTGTTNDKSKKNIKIYWINNVELQREFDRTCVDIKLDPRIEHNDEHNINEIKVYALRLKTPHFASNTLRERFFEDGAWMLGNDWDLAECPPPHPQPH